MASTWESLFSEWATPPGTTEQHRCKNAEKAIKNAISKSSSLQHRDIGVFTQGSYRNNTNVKKDSDVDIGICCHDTFFPEYPDGITDKTFGHIDSDYKYSTFKQEVLDAMIQHFGQSSVIRGNKAINIRENSYHVEADITPFFEHRRYNINGSFISGVELRPDNGIPFRVINWPEQHYSNGVTKNNITKHRYKYIVRILKTLCIRMQDDSIGEAKGIPGFLIECLVWNVPNENFGHVTLQADVRANLAHLFNNTINDEKCSEWGEVSELKYLFRGTNKWTRIQAHNFISAAWNYIGFE